MSYSTTVEAYLYACTRSSPANVLANYGELEKSGRFFSEVGGLGLTRLEFVDLGNGIDVLRHNAMHQRDLQTRSTMHAYLTTFQSGRISHLPMRQWHGCGEKQKAGHRKTSLSACRAKCSFSAT